MTFRYYIWVWRAARRASLAVGPVPPPRGCYVPPYPVSSGSVLQFSSIEAANLPAQSAPQSWIWDYKNSSRL